MPFCPKCGFEYRKEFTHCPDCDCDLIEVQLDQLDQKDGLQGQQEDMVFLTNVPDGPLGETTISKLRAYHIPYYTSYDGQGIIGTLYTGKSLSGRNLFVPSTYLQEARELLENTGIDYSQIMPLEYSIKQEEKRYQSEVLTLLEQYRKNTDLLVEECLSCEGRTILLYAYDSVLAVVRLCNSGRLGIFVHINELEQDVFDAAFLEAERLAYDMGVTCLWAEIPRCEVGFVGQYMQHGFIGNNRGEHYNVRGKTVDILYLERIIQNTTK